MSRPSILLAAAALLLSVVSSETAANQQAQPSSKPTPAKPANQTIKTPNAPASQQSTHYPILLLGRGGDPLVWSILIGQKGPERFDRAAYPPMALTPVSVSVEGASNAWAYHAKDAVETYYDRSELIGVTTETVRENLLVGMVLVTVILLMFLSNVRSALIVAINIPLALLFAFSVLYLRGKSANLLSIGAVDFGIIVDSSVIMVENIYRHLSSGEYADLPLKERILQAAHEVERAPVLLDGHHGLRLPAAVHDAGARKDRSSARWPTPTPSPWAARCCWR